MFSARDRMDNRPDRIRSVHDGRWHYIRNFNPELPYDQPIPYEDNSIVMKTWRQLHNDGKLSGAPALYFAPTKPKEEFYDMQADPNEVNNLAASSDPAAQAELKKLSAAMDEWITTTKDLGELSEDELVARGLVANHPSRNPQPATPAK